MTVAELRAVLAQFSDDALVTVFAMDQHGYALDTTEVEVGSTKDLVYDAPDGVAVIGKRHHG